MKISTRRLPSLDRSCRPSPSLQRFPCCRGVRIFQRGRRSVPASNLENGRASYRNRWVRTPKWLAEHDAGRALFGGFGQKLADAPSAVARDGGVANTNIVFHSGRLLALEEAHGGIYRYMSKADLDRTFSRAYRKIDRQMSAVEFWRLVAPAVAQIKCGYTSIWLPEDIQTRILTEIPLLSLTVKVFDGRLYVYRDYSTDNQKLEGDEVVSINGVSAKRIVKTMMTIRNSAVMTTSMRPTASSEECVPP